MKRIIFAAAMVAILCVSNAFPKVKKVEPVKVEQTATKKAEVKAAKEKVVKATKTTKPETKVAKKTKTN